MSIKVLIQTTLLWYNIMTFGTTIQWRIQGRGAKASPVLFLDQTETRGVEKFFWRPPPLSQGLDDHPRPAPPYLKFSIRHCYYSGNGRGYIFFLSKSFVFFITQRSLSK